MTTEELPVQQIRISVLQSWAFVDSKDGSITVDMNTTAYRSLIDRLKYVGEADGLSLPWPTSRNRFWQYQLGYDYKSTDSRDLVAALIPFWHEETTFDAVEKGHDRLRDVFTFEYFRQPFAVGTAIHGSFADQAPRQETNAFVDMLGTTLRARLAMSNRQFRDGVPLSWIPGLPDRDVSKNAARFRRREPVVVLSGLQDRQADPLAVASNLASNFEGSKDKAVGLKTVGGAVAVDDNVIAIVLPASMRRAGTVLKCLHHNLATATVLVENMLAIQQDDAKYLAEWYRHQAAAILTAMHIGEPMPKLGTVYKSALVKRWIDRSGKIKQINSFAPRAQWPPTAPIP